MRPYQGGNNGNDPPFVPPPPQYGAYGPYGQGLPPYERGNAEVKLAEDGKHNMDADDDNASAFTESTVTLAPVHTSDVPPAEEGRTRRTNEALV
jgi:hypothetical protein